MQDFQDVKGSYGYVTLPGTHVQLSLNKKNRWLWTFDEGEVTHTTYTTRGIGCEPPESLTRLRRENPPIVELEYVGRSLSVPRGKRGPGVVCDQRHAAFSAAHCCGCTFCSRTPRNKALKKTKGMRKHAVIDQ